MTSSRGFTGERGWDFGEGDKRPRRIPQEMRRGQVAALNGSDGGGVGREPVPALVVSELLRVVPEHVVLLEEVVDGRGLLAVNPAGDGGQQGAEGLVGRHGGSSYRRRAST